MAETRGKMSSLKKIEEGLARARAGTRAAGRSRNYTSEKEEVFIPRGVVYRNPYAFQQVFCDANTSDRFQPIRDISLPDVNIPVDKLGPPHLDQPPNERPILAFFAGAIHGYIRKVLFKYWKDKDDEIQVYDDLPTNRDYAKSMGDSKFCLCPGGYEVASPRVLEAIAAGCVPVLISDNYVPPFSDVHDWSKFFMCLSSDKIPEIKKILKAVPHERYLELQERVKQVQRHFVINRPTQPYDMLHMILHSMWLRRLNVRLS